MAITSTARGTAASNASNTTTYGFSPGSNFAAGSLAVLCVSADNSSSGGSTNNVSSVADTKGNTWTKRRSPLFDNGAASAGIQGAIFDCKQEKGLLTTGDTITVTFGANTQAKSYALWELLGAAGTQPAYQTGGESTGTTSAAPTVTTSSLTSGDAVVGVMCVETGTENTETGDSDSTNGSWSSQQTAEVGSTTTGNAISSQTKVVTGTATQTYNPTLTNSSDVILSWASYRETSNVQALTIGFLDASSALYAPTLAPPPPVTVSLPLIGGAAFVDEIAADSPLGWWRHGAADSGSQGTDASGNGRHLLYAEASGTPYTPSHVSGLLSGDSDTAFGPSANGHAGVAAWGSNLPATNFTLEAIINVPDLSTTRVLWSCNPFGGGWAVVIPTSGVIRLENGTDNDVHASVAISANTQYHLVVTYGAGANSGKIYLEGVDRTAADTGCTFTTSAGMFVGAYSADPLYQMGSGSVIDESIVFGSVLSQARITAHFNAISGGGAQAVLYAPTLSQAGASSITLGLLDAGPALYAPTAIPGPVAISVPFLDGAPALYAPALSMVVAPPLLDAAAALYAPTLTPKNLLSIAFLDAGAALYAPTILPGPVSVTVPLLDGGPALYAPTLLPAQFLTIPLLDGAPALYAPSVLPAQGLTIPLLDGSPALYAPTVLPGAAGVTLALLDGAPALYAPSLAFSLAVPLLDGAPALYPPALAPQPVGLTIPLLDSGPAVYAPGVIPAQFLTVPLLDGGPAVYAPSLLPQPVGVTLGLLDGSPALYAPSLAPQSTLTVPLLDGSPALHAPTLLPGQVGLTLPLLDAGRSVYAPTIASGQIIGLDLITSGGGSLLLEGGGGRYLLEDGSGTYLLEDDAGAALYAPTLSPGAVTVALALLDGGPTVYAPTVAGALTISLSVLDAARAVYAPTVAPGAVTVSPPTIDSGPTVYAPTLAAGAVTVSLGLLDAAPALYGPTVSTTTALTIPYLDSAAALYGPVLYKDEFVTLPLLDSGPAVYDPTITGGATITFVTLDSAPALYAPTLLADQLLSPPLLDAAAALYPPAVLAGQALSLPVLDGAASLYAPAVAAGSVGLDVPLLDSGAAIFPPAVAPAAWLLSLPLFDAGAVLYAPTLLADQLVSLPLFDGGSALYPPGLAFAAAIIPATVEVASGRGVTLTLANDRGNATVEVDNDRIVTVELT